MYNPYSYRVTPVYGVRPPPHRFSRTELIHLTVAAVVLSFDFTLLFSLNGTLYQKGLGVATVGAPLSFQATEFNVAAAVMIAITGFAAHEIAHKLTAQRRGLWAEFRLSIQGLVLSIVFSVIGILIAAPGATYIGGTGTAEEAGVTSIAGPAVNVVGAIGFVGAGFGVFHLGMGELADLLLTVGTFDLWFAVFNLIPLGPLDGRKVWRWNKGIWVASFVGCAAGFVVLFLFF